jgi:hypothetical protein
LDCRRLQAFTSKGGELVGMSKRVVAGETNKAEGIALASQGLGCERLIMTTQLEMLRVIRQSPDRVATIDDATAEDELEGQYPQNGKWRGAAINALAKCGLIAPYVKDGYRTIALSTRPSRHRGHVSLWQAAVDDDALDLAIARLRRNLDALNQQCVS